MTSTPAGRQGFFLLSSKNISLKKGDEALQDGVKRDYGVTEDEHHLDLQKTGLHQPAGR